MITIRNIEPKDIIPAIAIWNEVVEEGVAFPQKECLTPESGAKFFSSQSCTEVAVDAQGAIVGLYILHPNNVGRAGHIANASYAVKKEARGNHVGRVLVTASLAAGSRLGFRILQFNAVVRTNVSARHLYESLGFQQLGTIPGGFLKKDGTYEDICPYYILLK